MQVLDVYQVIDIVSQAGRRHTAALLGGQHQHAWGQQGGPRRGRHLQGRLQGLQGLHHREGEGGRHHGLLLELLEVRGGRGRGQTAGDRREAVGGVAELGLRGHQQQLAQGAAHTLPLGYVDRQHHLLRLGLLTLNLTHTESWSNK